MIDFKFIVGFALGIVVANIYPAVASTIYAYLIAGWQMLQGAL